MTRRVFRYSALGLVLVATLAYGAYNFTGNAEASGAKTAAATAPAAGSEGGKTLKEVIDPSKTYATFEGGSVTGKDVQAFIANLPPALQGAPDQLLPMIVNQMVNDRLVAIAADKMKLAEDAATKKRIQDATEQVIRDRYVEKYLDGKVSDAKVKAKYDTMIKNAKPQEEIRARHILVADETVAKDVIARLGKGEKFEDLAKKFSIDPSKEQGGDLGYVTKDLMVKEFGDALFAMKKGDVSKAPVKTQFGYHVIKVEDRRQQQKPTFEQVKEALGKQLADEEVRNMVKNLRDKANVKINLPK